ncbi:MAG: DUF4271 domain-containing protein [Paludibacteraceae bacterium]|nr:DUF4271 domain-containing protein [Paludibacteraceae bacterium]
MNGITHIISPANAGWVSWILLALMACALVAEFLQRGLISQAVQSLITRSNRTYKEAQVNLWAQALIYIFRIGTIALALCLCCYSGETFTLAAFGAVCGLIIGLLILKIACQGVLDYTFRFSRMFESAYEPYANIMTLVALILYPTILVLLRVDNTIAAKWCVGIVATVFMLLWLYRGGRIFIQSPRAILYFVIYMATLEFLPMMALYYLSEITIKHL